MTINSRGISVSLHQWEDSDQVKVRAYSGVRGERMVHIEVWSPGGLTPGGLNMTHFNLFLLEGTATAILEQLAQMYPTACAEALGYEEAPD